RTRLPVVLARPPQDGPSPIRRILLPLAGTVQARAATEVAIPIAAHHGASLFLLHLNTDAAEPQPVGPVHDDPGGAAAAGGRPSVRAVRRQGARSRVPGDDPGEELLDRAASLARESAVRSRRVIVRHPTRGLAIVEAARRIRADVVVIGVTPQPVADRV